MLCTRVPFVSLRPHCCGLSVTLPGTLIPDILRWGYAGLAKDGTPALEAEYGGAGDPGTALAASKVRSYGFCSCKRLDEGTG